MRTSRFFYLTTLLLTLIYPTNLQAKLYQSDKVLGTCSGIDDNSGPGEVTEARKKLEIKCEKYDNEKKGCEKEEECRWIPKPQVCEARNESVSEEDALFCDKILDKKECLKNSLKCNWGYKSPTCNAADLTNKRHVDFCERFDGTDEDRCEGHSIKCNWD